MTIEWTETARQDLREIRRFIARDSQKYAARMTARIREAVELMSANPEAGHFGCRKSSRETSARFTSPTFASSTAFSANEPDCDE